MSASIESFAGRLLYRHLPEEYRYRDNPSGGEPGDLETYLHGFGHILDRIRTTIEQMHADSFAEALDEPDWLLPLLSGKAGAIAPQPWILPYLAELIGAELAAPDSAARTRELNKTALWFKSKGTLPAIDDIADTVANAETVTVEGWTRTLATPRLSLPPFSVKASRADPGDPRLPPAAPLGTPDLRRRSRAVEDPSGQDPMNEFTIPGRPAIHWRIVNRRGAPCFPGSYEDASVRTPDVRSPGRGGSGIHPGRIGVHVQPPEGLFATGLIPKAIPADSDLGLAAAGQPVTWGPKEVYAALGLPAQDAPGKLALTGPLAIAAHVDATFEDILFTGTLSVHREARLTLVRGAAGGIVLGAAEVPIFTARDSLIGRIDGALSGARLEFVTVLGDCALKIVQASDCIFGGPLTDFHCGGASCIRYSRLAAPIGDQTCGATNSYGPVRFLPRYIGEGAACNLRIPGFGEPGCGVLAHDAGLALRTGSEDGGEIGAHHHLNHCAALTALARKLEGFMPAGLSAVLLYDSRLATAPPRLKGSAP